MSDEMMTTSGAAKFLDMPEQTVRSLANRGLLLVERDSVGRRLFTRKNLELFAKTRQREAAKKAKSKAA